MEFFDLIWRRRSCRAYDAAREIEPERLTRVLEAARLAPSACNGQPYLVTVCKGETAREVALATRGVGLNRFAVNAPILLVISERPYVATAALGARLKGNAYRSMDIGIVAAYLSLAATEVGLESCILGWFDEKKVRELSGADGTVRLVITLGYPGEDDKILQKKRKTLDELVRYADGETNDKG